MFEHPEQSTIHCLAIQFRQTEILRVGGRQFACRTLKLEQVIDTLSEQQARNLAYTIFHHQVEDELKGYLLAWFDGMGYGEYTYSQVLKNI